MFKKSQLKHIARLHCASVLDATDIYMFEESKNLLTEKEQYFILLEIKKWYQTEIEKIYKVVQNKDFEERLNPIGEVRNSLSYLNKYIHIDDCIILDDKNISTIELLRNYPFRTKIDES